MSNDLFSQNKCFLVFPDIQQLIKNYIIISLFLCYIKIMKIYKKNIIKSPYNVL